jgi:hypothetical protein
MTTLPQTSGSVTAPTEDKVQFYRTKSASRFGFFMLALLLHLLLFLLIASWVIFESPKPETDASFGQVKSLPVKVPPPVAPPASGSSASNPHLEPQQVVVPVAAPIKTVTSINASFTVDASKALNQALTHVSMQQAPQATGLAPAGQGPGSGPGTSPYGSRSGDGQELVGSLYDLQQTPDRKKTQYTEDNDPSNWSGLAFLRSFVKDWDMSTLDQFYKAPNPLYATQIFIPKRESEESTKAFGVDKVVQAKRWIIVYNANVVAPVSGTYRFAGWADDFLVVRWNGENVLDACYGGEELDMSVRIDNAGGYMHGKWIQMEAGVAVPMQVMIGEGPGGFSGFLLTIQKKGEENNTGDDPVFQLRDAPIPDVPGMPKEFMKKKMIFAPAP